MPREDMRRLLRCPTTPAGGCAGWGSPAESSASGTNPPRPGSLDVPSMRSVIPNRPSHTLTTSPIVGRRVGHWSQHLSKSFHTCTVSPIPSASDGHSGLSPRDIRVVACTSEYSSNRGLPVKTVKAKITKAKTSAGLDSISVKSRGGSAISGASHLGFLTAGDASVRSELVLMSASP